MVTCGKCKNNKWRVFKVSFQRKKRLPTKTIKIVCLKCIECGNRQYAYYKNGKITIPRKDIETTNDYNFNPLECLCKSNDWKILRDVIICNRCKKEFSLDTGMGIKVSKKLRTPRKEKDYWGTKMR